MAPQEQSVMNRSLVVILHALRNQPSLSGFVRRVYPFDKHDTVHTSITKLALDPAGRKLLFSLC